jgi:hypothetical protein
MSAFSPDSDRSVDIARGLKLGPSGHRLALEGPLLSGAGGAFNNDRITYFYEHQVFTDLEGPR